MEKGPLFNSGEKSKKDTLGKIIRTAVIAAGVISGQAGLHTDAHAGESSVTEQVKSHESELQKLSIRNENILNIELEKSGIEGVRLGRCVGTSFSIYTIDGDYLFDMGCTQKDFTNPHFFREFAQLKIIPKLITYIDEQKIKEEVTIERTPQELLRIASFDFATINFFTKHALTLVPRINKNGKYDVCIDRVQGSKLPQLTESTCYDSFSKSATFAYESKSDTIRVHVINLDGEGEGESFSPLYKNGILIGFK